MEPNRDISIFRLLWDSSEAVSNENSDVCTHCKKQVEQTHHIPYETPRHQRNSLGSFCEGAVFYSVWFFIFFYFNLSTRKTNPPPPPSLPFAHKSLVLWPLLFSSETGSNHFMTHPNTWRLRTPVVNAGSDFSPVIASTGSRDMLFTRHTVEVGL